MCSLLLLQIVFAALLGIAVAQVRQQQQQEVRILEQELVNQGDGTFRYAFETSDGTRAESSGYIKNPNEPDPEQRIQSVQGYYRHVADDGQTYQVTYTADENGFNPSGDHLPTPPPIPEAILRALEIVNGNAKAQINRAQQQQRPRAG